MVDVLNYLKKSKLYKTRKELALEIFTSEGSIQKQLSSLKKRDLISIKKIKAKTGQDLYTYGYKEVDDIIPMYIKEYQTIKAMKDYTYFSPECILNLMILKRLDVLCEPLNNDKQNM